MLIFVRMAGLFGALGWAALLMGVIASPKTFEHSAVGFAKQQVEAEVTERYPGLADGRLASGARRLSQSLGLKQSALKKDANSDLPELISRTISAYCGCTDQAKMEARAETIRDGLKARIAKLGLAQSNLLEIIKGRYDEIIGTLKTDLMIFLSTNLAAFAGVFAVSFVPRERRGLVVIPGVLLLIAAAISSYIYLAEQDWFYAIIFQDYYGWGYSLGMALIFGLLMDIVVNQARICMNIAASLPGGLIPQC